jgi:uridine kinase
MPHLILIAGFSCSGKTTLANSLARELGAAKISLDDYYRPYNELTLAERKLINFDAPDSIEHELITDHLTRLLAGEVVHKPCYDFAEFARRTETEPIFAADVIVVEGLFSLAWEDLVSLAGTRIYVDTPEAVCLARRLERDLVERGRGEVESLSRYREHVRPNQERYILPTKQNANLLISGDQPAHQILEAAVRFTAERSRTFVL